MKKVVFIVPDPLLERIDQIIERWGFSSYAEFFRFAAIDFMRNDGRLLPADNTLKEHTKAIRRVTAQKDAIAYEKDWLKHGDTTLY
ncbi:MAG: hypothetical protein ABH856_00560 [Patescibacteria group bacterium]|nr:ribbon-helix-helix domain-containing protein [Patescibacteria group bacterium]